jgi:hypothetical protein
MSALDHRNLWEQLRDVLPVVLNCWINANASTRLAENQLPMLVAHSQVCRHHAAAVAEGCGNATCFVCPYHGWTYGTPRSSWQPPGARLLSCTT